jgi:hypothetical protein
MKISGEFPRFIFYFLHTVKNVKTGRCVKIMLKSGKCLFMKNINHKFAH